MLKSNWIKMGLSIVKYTLVIFALLISIILLTTDFEIKECIIDSKQYVINAFIDDEIIEEEIIPIEEPVDDTYVSKMSLVGDLTGYAADCPACNGTLGCLPSYNVYRNGVITYLDKVYGNVRIVASSKNLACGSIIKFNSNRVSNEDTYAIVLDRGVLSNDIDLLVPTERYAYDYIGRSKITYDVLRFGW